MPVKNLIVEFEIPYLLEVKDSFTKNPNWRFKVYYNSVEAEFRFRKRVVDEGRVDSKFVREDRNGLLSRTTVQIHFNDVFYKAIPDRTEEEIPDANKSVFYELPGEYSRYVIGWSLDFLNQFLDSYRAHLGDSWIRHVGLSDVLDFEVTMRQESGESDTAYYFLGAKPVKSLRVDSDLRDNIQDFISKERSMNMYKEIDLDTQDNIAKREWDIAVLNSARLFEVWTKSVYIALMDRRDKLQESEARRIAIETPWGSFIEQKFPADTGINIDEFPEYQKWDKDVWDVRGDIIHDGRKVEKETADEAFNTTKKLIGRILDLVGDELENTNLHAEVDYP